MTVHSSAVRDLPDSLQDEGLFFERLAGRRPAEFLHYDGLLAPVVDRPEDAAITKGVRTTVRALTRRCPVCVISGRDPAGALT
jgi:trehalose 6-phosphate phosphatase